MKLIGVWRAMSYITNNENIFFYDGLFKLWCIIKLNHRNQSIDPSTTKHQNGEPISDLTSLVTKIGKLNKWKE